MYINVQYQFKGSLPAVLPAGLDGDGVSEKRSEGIRGILLMPVPRV